MHEKKILKGLHRRISTCSSIDSKNINGGVSRSGSLLIKANESSCDNSEGSLANSPLMMSSLGPERREVCKERVRLFSPNNIFNLSCKDVGAEIEMKAAILKCTIIKNIKNINLT